MAHRLTPAATVLLVAAILVPAPVTANHPLLVEDGVATFLEPAFDPFATNPLPGDRLALTAGNAFTLNEYVTPFGTATQTIGIGGTTGGMFWEFIPGGGWRADVRQADGPISVSISYVATDCCPVAYPADAQGIGFTTGMTDEQLASISIDGQFRLVNANGDAGVFNFSNEDILRDATNKAIMFKPHGEFVAITSGATYSLTIGSLTQADLILSLDRFNIEVDDAFALFASGTFGIVSVQPIPIPAVAFLFPAGLIAGIGWMRRRQTR